MSSEGVKRNPISDHNIQTFTDDTDNDNDVKKNHRTQVSPDMDSDNTIFVFQSPQ